MTNIRKRQIDAFTLVELLVVIGIIAVLAALLIPGLSNEYRRARRINCVGHLKNIGLAFRTAAVDSGSFIWATPLNKGGVDPSNFGKSNWLFFAALSNELSTPKILACPNDDRRSRSNTWRSVELKDHDGALSYFIGPSASEDQPQTILSGDRNITNLANRMPIDPDNLTTAAESYFTLKREEGERVALARDLDAPGFTGKIHRNAGNLLLGDGSVQQVTNARLREQLTDAAKSIGDQRFAFPLKK